MLKLSAGLALLAVPFISLTAQVTIPGVELKQGGPIGSVSANEAAFFMAVREVRISSASSKVYEDSLKVLLSYDAREWIERLNSNPVKGLQLDSYGRLKVIAGEESDAERIFAERLNTPGLSVIDKGYTYLTAVLAFSSVSSSDKTLGSRLAIAEKYLSGLTALGDTVAMHQFQARRQLAGVYYALGQSKDVLRHAMKAVALLPAVEMPDRKVMFWDASFYSEMVDVLAAQPDAPQKIAALNQSLKLGAAAPSHLVAKDSAFYYMGEGYQRLLDQMIKVGMRVGTPAVNIEGNYWANMPAPGSVGGPMTMSVADGKIRVLEMGHYTCPQCRTAMMILQKLQDRYPDIQVVSATATQGSWSNRNVSPEEEAEHLREFYTTKLGVKFPISIWKGELKPTDDGGMLPENYGPNFEHYPLADKPNIYVIDGKGTIRRVFVGSMSSEHEKQLIKLIEFLRKETNA